MEYVCGFMMSWDMHEFFLIRKTHPKWQKGKWNGIGGKIENTQKDPALPDIVETPQEAMVREFKEETGIETSIKRWHCFHIEQFKNDTKVYYLSAFGDEIKKYSLGSFLNNREEIKKHTLIDIFWDRGDYIYNLYYLIHMIIYNMRAGSFYQLNPQGVNFKCEIRYAR